jgi:type IV secretion system protein VirB1
MRRQHFGNDMIDDIPYQCTQGVSLVTMQQIIRVESGGNPFAIGVVGGHLERQPKTLSEAVATVRSLEQNGFNYSIGISQVNRIHFARLGWKEAIENGFDVCTNLKAGAGIYRDCYNGALRAGYRHDGNAAGNSGSRIGDRFDADSSAVGSAVGSATRASLSCYYSGNFVTGEKLGYVSKVLGTESAATPGAIIFAKKTAASMFD